MIVKLRIFFQVFAVLFLSACYPFGPMRQQPKTDFCYFDPKDRSVKYTGAEAGIIKAEINTVTSETSYISNYFKADYQTPVTKIDMSKMDTALLKKGFIMINVWDRMPAMEPAYWIFIRPADWQSVKPLYSKYNSRH